MGYDFSANSNVELAILETSINTCAIVHAMKDALLAHMSNGDDEKLEQFEKDFDTILLAQTSTILEYLYGKYGSLPDGLDFGKKT